MAAPPILTRLPIIGDDIAQVGQVVDLLARPCSPTPSLWVGAFWHNVPLLLWSLFKPEPQEIIESRFGLGHRRRKRPRMMPTDIWPADNSVPGWGRAIWRTHKFTQKIGWWLLVVDATTDFAVNWVSTAYQWQGCDPSTEPHCDRYGEGDQFLSSASGWQHLVTSIMSEHTFHGAGWGISVPAGYVASLSASVETSPSEDWPGTLGTVQIFDDTHGKPVADGQPTTGPDGRQSATLTANVPQHPSLTTHYVALMSHGGGGTTRTTRRSFSAYGSTLPMLYPDP